MILEPPISMARTSAPVTNPFPRISRVYQALTTRIKTIAQQIPPLKLTPGGGSDRLYGMSRVTLNLKVSARLFDDAKLAELLSQSMAVLKATPFRVHGTDEFFDHLRGYGCQVDSNLVRFPDRVIDSVLARIAEEKSRGQSVHSGDGTSITPEAWPDDTSSDPIRMFTHGQALHICDTATNELRPATVRDLESWCRLVDSFGDLDRSHPTFIPTDVPRRMADLRAFATIALNSASPHRVSAYSAKMIPYLLAVQTVISGSEEKAKQTGTFATKCWVNSPFAITRENIEIAMEARRLLGRPVAFGVMPVAGGSTPVSIAGSLVQNVAESIGICAMRLALDDLVHPVVATSAVLDFRHVTHRQSGPDVLLHHVAGADMYEYLHGTRPSIPHLGVSAQTAGPQSLYEKAMSASQSVSLGTRSLGVGCLAYSDVGSPVQLLLDYELGSVFRHLFREISADENHVGVSTILQTASVGAGYMDTEHTARLFREETWLPDYIDPRPPMAWAENPGDMIESARKRALELEASAENRCPLSDAAKQQIGDIVTDARRAVSIQT